VLLAVSRVYVGTHYVGDVLGGVVTGLIATVLVRVAYREGSKLDRRVTGIL
jgi:undecaprenyl-diphosphatase